MKMVIITACSTGVAHSRMCSAALKKEAETRGHTVATEMQGGHNLTTQLSREVCQDADIILIAYAIIIGISWGNSQNNINDNSDDILYNKKYIESNGEVIMSNQLDINTLSAGVTPTLSETSCCVFR